MKKSLLFSAKQLKNPSGTNLLIRYYLLISQSEKNNHFLYGIRIHSFSPHDPGSSSHTEEIPNISYSKSYVTTLLTLCSHHLVTPTDLYSSVDTLMNLVS